MIVRLVVQGPQQGKPPGALGQAGKQLADVEAGNRRGDRLERPPVFGRGIGLHVEGIEVARPTPEPEQDHGASGGFRALRRGSQRQQVAPRQPQSAD